MKDRNENCTPVVECEVLDPFKKSSVLAENQCFRVYTLINQFIYIFFFCLFIYL